MTLARRVCVGAVLAFLVTGALGSRWISLAHFDDPLVFGRHYLWGALDSGTFHFSDTVVFFDPRPLEHALHPGLTVDLINALWMRPLGEALAAREGVPYLTHMVVHQRAYFGAASFLSTVFFLLCCWPLHGLVRALRGPEAALWACTLHLTSMPVLLFANRLSSEAYLLFFGLVALRLILVPAGPPCFLRAFALGLTGALSLLAKPLCAALVPLALVTFGRELPWRRRVAAWGAALLGAAGPLLVFVIKLPPQVWLFQLQDDLRRNRDVAKPWDTFALPHQAPLVSYHLLFVILAIVGCVVIWRQADEGSRRRLRPLGMFLLLSMLLVTWRPDWHYYYAFFWALPVAALAALEAGLRRAWPRLTRATTVAAPLLLVLTLPWTLGVATAYKQYRDRFERRAAAYARSPLEQPALWERRPGDLHLDTALREGWPRTDARLLAELARLRARR
jgi:hypothetical protein